MKVDASQMGPFDELVEQLGDTVTRKQMMGSPTLMRGAAMVACFDGAVLSVRLGRDSAEFGEAMAVPGADLWHPGGGDRVFKDWVALPPTARDRWLDAVRAAIDLADEIEITGGGGGR